MTATRIDPASPFLRLVHAMRQPMTGTEHVQ
jgi:hypothetical protein